MKLTMEEQETIIRLERLSENAIIYTTDTTVMTKLDKKCEGEPDYWYRTEEGFLEGELISKTYECPKSFVSFRNKPKQGKPMTYEQKMVLSERMKDLHEQGKL